MVETAGGFLGYFVTSRRAVINTPSLVIELEQITDSNEAEQFARSSIERRGGWGTRRNKTMKSTSWGRAIAERDSIKRWCWPNNNIHLSSRNSV